MTELDKQRAATIKRRQNDVETTSKRRWNDVETTSKRRWNDVETRTGWRIRKKTKTFSDAKKLIRSVKMEIEKCSPKCQPHLSKFWHHGKKNHLWIKDGLSHISIYVKYYGKGFFNSQSWHLLPHFAPQTVWLRFSYHLMLGLGIELTSAELHLLEGLNSRRFTDWATTPVALCKKLESMLCSCAVCLVGYTTRRLLCRSASHQLVKTS